MLHPAMSLATCLATCPSGDEVKVEGVFLLADRTKHCETSCKRGVTLCNASKKSVAAFPQSLRKVELDSSNNNEVFLRMTNHTGQAEKNLLGQAGIRTRDLRFTSPMLYQLSYRSSWEAGRQMMVLGLFDISKYLIIIFHPSSMSHNNYLNLDSSTSCNGLLQHKCCGT